MRGAPRNFTQNLRRGIAATKRVSFGGGPGLTSRIETQRCTRTTTINKARCDEQIILTNVSTRPGVLVALTAVVHDHAFTVPIAAT